MVALHSSALARAGLVQPLPARVAAFRPVTRSPKTLVSAKATPEKSQTQNALALGAVASTFLAAGTAHATDLVAAGGVEAADLISAASDNRAALLATLFVPALAWVAYNIMEPALNQFQNMRLKGAATAVGLTAGSLMLAEQADAANQVSELAATDNRALILAVIFVPALGWVAFNILGPALNQLANMASQGKGGSRRR